MAPFSPVTAQFNLFSSPVSVQKFELWLGLAATGKLTVLCSKIPGCKKELQELLFVTQVYEYHCLAVFF